MFNAARFAVMKPSAYIINTARGGIVDEDALCAAMLTGHVRAAGLDTFQREPLPSEHPLIGLKKAILSPHSAALTEESLLAMGLATARNALDGIDGKLNPALVVNRSVLADAIHAG
jgi:D-3-phosphoglycerate dehydrogenase